ncbi:hypothetical protein [Microbacterium terrisoli]|uniref:hypothetical protein n=1 Tax=Microbacterium terrisoli TaxID=3242192 RepID=UPI002805F301|nr:hypothetical protein [Microbacterium protaetiae]
MIRTDGRAVLLALVITGGLALAGCAASTPSPAGSGRAQHPAPTQTVSGSGDNPTPAGDPTCDTIIPKSTVDAFTAVGWSSRQDPFYVGNIELPGGIQCIWGNEKVPSDDVQVYGWAPITPEQETEVTQELSNSGFQKLSEDGQTYMTATDSMPGGARDSGMTYRLDDGQILFSDTKQGLLLIEWPPAP